MVCNIKLAVPLVQTLIKCWFFVEMPFSPRSKSVRMFSDEVSESTSIDGEEAVVGRTLRLNSIFITF